MHQEFHAQLTTIFSIHLQTDGNEEKENSESTEHSWIIAESDFFATKIVEWRQIHIDIAQKILKQAASERLSKIKACNNQKGKKSTVSIPIERNNVKTLLNGQNPPESKDAISILGEWGYHTVNLIIPFDDDDIRNDAIDIPQINQEVFKTARLMLEKHFLKASEQFWIHYEAYLNQAIEFRVNRILKEKENNIIESELLADQIELAANMRLEELPKLKALHEKEADFLIYQVEQTELRYKTGITKIIEESNSFLGEIKIFQDKAPKLNSSERLQREQKLFSLKIKAHEALTKSNLNTVLETFEREKMSLVKSKEIGNHAAAWQIISERNLIMNQTLADFDDFKEKIYEGVEVSFKTLREQLTSLSELVEFQMQYYQFMEKTTAYQKRLRLYLSSEVFLFKNIVEADQKKLNLIKSNLETAETGASLQEGLTELSLFAIQLAQTAFYFNLYTVQEDARVVEGFDFSANARDWISSVIESSNRPKSSLSETGRNSSISQLQEGSLSKKRSSTSTIDRATLTASNQDLKPLGKKIESKSPLMSEFNSSSNFTKEDTNPCMARVEFGPYISISTQHDSFLGKMKKQMETMRSKIEKLEKVIIV